MKTVAKIDPEQEYLNAKAVIEQALNLQRLDQHAAVSLDRSVDNLITAARVLMDREDRRRGKKAIPKQSSPKGRKKGESREEARKLPSERFPSLEILEDKFTPDEAPTCPCCQEKMKESGLIDITEKLHVRPKEYYIQRTIRPKYNCAHCHGSLVNTPAPPSIVPLSNYGDSIIIDACLSKFCDLIPMERYTEMAARSGVEGIPPQTLIGLSHHLANFLEDVYEKIKQEVLKSLVLLADETSHKMLEGDQTKNWFLWGFFSDNACYFELHRTRSGDVPLEFLKKSEAKYLMTDGYGGYDKALRLLKEEEGKEVIEAGCNAHGVRYFKEAGETWKEECASMLELYGNIYELEEKRREGSEKLSAAEQLDLRRQMIPYFKELKGLCEQAHPDAMSESGFKKALGYFLNQYDALTLCTKDIRVPLDNNHSERLLRSPVVGRKTWYGTHSKRGALTMAVHFSIVQSCNVNQINPRNYYPWVVDQILRDNPPLTPFEYSKLKPPETQ